MRPAASIVVCAVALAQLASAWPTWLPRLDSILVMRQDGSSSQSPSATPFPTKPVSTNLNTARIPSATDTGATEKPKETDGTNTATDGETKPTPTEFNQVDPAGSVVMVTPPPLGGGVNLYKIGDHVTFAWNYTNLQATPTAINVLVSCSKARETWTLTSNMTFASSTFTWDTQEQATAVESPLLTEQYTLIIFDAESSISATPVPGYLGVFSGFTFGMYTPQPYVPLNEWNCATCSSAAPSLERSAIGFAITMSVVAVASFTWFVAGLNLV